MVLHSARCIVSRPEKQIAASIECVLQSTMMNKLGRQSALSEAFQLIYQIQH